MLPLRHASSRQLEPVPGDDDGKEENHVPGEVFLGAVGKLCDAVGGKHHVQWQYRLMKTLRLGECTERQNEQVADKKRLEKREIAPGIPFDDHKDENQQKK